MSKYVEDDQLDKYQEILSRRTKLTSKESSVVEVIDQIQVILAENAKALAVIDRNDKILAYCMKKLIHSLKD
jgi:hypothetical protein